MEGQMNPPNVPTLTIDQARGILPSFFLEHTFSFFLFFDFYYLVFFRILEAMRDAIATFDIEENKQRFVYTLMLCYNPSLFLFLLTFSFFLSRMQEVLAQAGDDPGQKMILLPPVVEEIQRETLNKYGFTAPNSFMLAVFQIQAFAPQDPEIAEGVAYLMSQFNASS